MQGCPRTQVLGLVPFSIDSAFSIGLAGCESASMWWFVVTASLLLANLDRSRSNPQASSLPCLVAASPGRFRALVHVRKVSALSQSALTSSSTPVRSLLHLPPPAGLPNPCAAA